MSPWVKGITNPLPVHRKTNQAVNSGARWVLHDHSYILLMVINNITSRCCFRLIGLGHQVFNLGNTGSTPAGSTKIFML